METTYDMFKSQLPDGITCAILHRWGKVWDVAVSDGNAKHSIVVELPVVVEVGNPRLAVGRAVCEALSGIEILRGNIDMAMAWHNGLFNTMK